MTVTSAEIVLAVDIGTTGIKAAAFDERLQCLGRTYTENRLLYPAPGWVEQDPAHFVSASFRLIRQLTGSLGEAASRIRALACSGQMAGTLGIDADWNAVRNYESILDPRSAVSRPLIEPHERRIVALAGGITSQLEKMLYWRDHYPDAYARIRKFIAPNAYVAGKLAGLTAEAAFTDPSFGHVNGVLNVITMDWDPELLDLFSLPRDRLPAVLPAETVVGTVMPAVAAELGLPGEVKVLAGAGDGAATFLGAGVARPGQALDLSGSSAVFGVYSDTYAPDVDARLLLNMKAPILPGWYLIYVNQFGRTHRWFVEEFCPDMVEGGLDEAYARLDRLAAELPPGSGRLFSVPHLSGRFSPPRQFYRGAWVGFGLGFTRAHFYRSLLEAHALELALVLSHLRSLSQGPSLEEVLASGGGARSDLWNQMKADVLGVTYKRLADAELSTLRGNALIAAQALGWPAADDAAVVSVDAEYQPNAELTRQYARLLADYQSFGEALEPVLARLYG